jgi:regulator of protease activity HflC (stomatin/prohibitin superfamily)
MSNPATGGAPIDGAWAQAVRLSFGFLFAAIGLLALAWAGSNLRIVPADARAAVLRLGAVARIEGPGLLLAWPQPVEQVVMLPGPDRQIAHRVHRFDGTPVALTGQPPEFQVSPDARSNAGFLLTGETGIVHLQAALFYRITDPRAYLLAAAHVPAALDRLFAAASVAVCAARGLDEILVARPGGGADAAAASREAFRADLVRETNRRLDALAEQDSGLGVRISRVDVAAALPGGAKAAFDRVLTATQTADAAIADARTEAARTALGARQQRLRILADAEAAAAERRAEATTAAAPVAAMAGQMQGPAGAAQLRALYYARAGALLGRAREVDGVDPQGGTRLLLPGPGAVR